MAYDEHLANRLREELAGEPGLSEKSMFGGLAFLINGNLAVGASGQGGLLLQVDPAETDELMQRPDALPFSMRGREMDGWLHVDTDGMDAGEQREQWVALGVARARALPPK